MGMIQSLTKNSYLDMLGKSADHAAFRHNLLVNNISNVNTPFYKRRDTADFEKLLREAYDRTSFKAKVEGPRHMSFGRKDLEEIHPEPVIVSQTRFRNDRSSVDMDIELAEISKNGMRYQVYLKKLGSYFQSFNGLLQGE